MKLLAINLSQFTSAYVLNSLAYLASGFILLFIGKLIFQLLNPKYKVNHEMVEKDNMAFAVAQAGYYIGLLMTIGSAVIGESMGLVKDLMSIGIYGALGIVLLNLSVIINDKLILRKFNVAKEIIDDQNVGTGVVVAANAIATGIIIFQSLTVPGVSLYATMLYWLIAQVLLIIAGWVYNLILPYDLHSEIEKDNVAVGIGYAGALVSIAIIVGFAIHMPLTDWGTFLAYILIYTVIGLVFLPVARFLTDKILLPGQKLTDELVNQDKPNMGAGLIEAFAYIGGAVLLTWIL